MSVPDFQSFFIPLLELASDRQVHSLKEAREKLAAHFELTEDDIAEMLPSGTQRKLDNRVAWAISYFVHAKVLTRPQKAHFQITERGLDLLKQGHDRIDIKVLNQFPEFVEFNNPKHISTDGPTDASEDSTPEENLQEAYESIRRDLANELLDKIIDNTPAFFENLVVDLMIAMGYGGSKADAGKSIGKSGDEGIDGIINEDKLGLDVIYLQAKKWDQDSTISRPEIQKFVGALHGKRAKKGVFITTCKFSEEAKKYVRSIDPKVILIDGNTLANYMIDYNLGVAITANYQVKRVDIDYFEEE